MKITLCGSAKFEDLFHKANKQLTIQGGHTVYSLAVFPSTKDFNKNWYSPEQKTILDLAHLAKIEESHAIFVVTDDTGYIGESTKREIIWAHMRGKTIYSPYGLLAHPESFTSPQVVDIGFGHPNMVQRVYVHQILDPTRFLEAYTPPPKEGEIIPF
jgi:hypothetical protein